MITCIRAALAQSPASVGVRHDRVPVRMHAIDYIGPLGDQALPHTDSCGGGQAIGLDRGGINGRTKRIVHGSWSCARDLLHLYLRDSRRGTILWLCRHPSWLASVLASRRGWEPPSRCPRYLTALSIAVADLCQASGQKFELEASGSPRTGSASSIPPSQAVSVVQICAG